MGLAIECENLVRTFRSQGLLGKKQDLTAIDGLNLAIEQGQVYGLLGPNGAGKTTTIKILSTILAPTRGTARVAGYDVIEETAKVQQKIGFIFGGDRGLYWRLSGRDNLLYFAALQGMSPRDADRRALDLLRRVGLEENARRRVDEYSRGMRQRLHIARGLLTDPEVLFMDEPTLGLDPQGARELRALIAELQSPTRTILLTTHYMFEADMLCDRVAIIDGGRLVIEGTPNDMKRAAPQLEVVEVEVVGVMDAAVQSLRQLDGVADVVVETTEQIQRVRVYCRDASHTASHVIRELSEETSLGAVAVRGPSLEDAYISLLSRARENESHEQ